MRRGRRGRAASVLAERPAARALRLPPPEPLAVAAGSATPPATRRPGPPAASGPQASPRRRGLGPDGRPERHAEGLSRPAPRRLPSRRPEVGARPSSETRARGRCRAQRFGSWEGAAGRRPRLYPRVPTRGPRPWAFQTIGRPAPRLPRGPGSRGPPLGRRGLSRAPATSGLPHQAGAVYDGRFNLSSFEVEVPLSLAIRVAQGALAAGIFLGAWAQTVTRAETGPGPPGRGPCRH